MSRRSERLVSQGYYDDNGLPIISYKETPYRPFKRRRRHPRFLEAFTKFPLHNCFTNDDYIINSQPGSEGFSMQPFIYLFILIFIVGLTFVIPNARQFRSEQSFKDLNEEILRLKSKVDCFLPEAQFLPNMALASLGAEIVPCRRSKSYNWMKPLSLSCKFHEKCKGVSPKVVIEGSPYLLPGNCWSFAGQEGHITIALPREVAISHVTLGHISSSVSPSGTILNAPKKFSVYGKKTVEDEGTLIGTFLYNKEGDEFQTFKIADHRKDVFSFVKLQVNSNWGDPQYTCLYSFRVHEQTSNPHR